MTETRRGFFRKVLGAVLAGLALPKVAQAVEPEQFEVSMDWSKCPPLRFKEQDQAMIDAVTQRYADAIDAEGLQRYRELPDLKWRNDSFTIMWAADGECHLCGGPAYLSSGMMRCHRCRMSWLEGVSRFRQVEAPRG